MLAQQSSSPLSVQLRVRLHACNLPKQGRLKNRTPRSYARVTSLEAMGCSRSISTSFSSMSSLNTRGVNIEAYNLGETEVVEGRSPRWTEAIDIEYQHGEEMFFYVHVLCPADISSRQESSSDFSATKEKSLGTAMFSVADVLGSKNSLKVKRLRSGGCVYCRIIVVEKDSDQMVNLQVSAQSIILPHNVRRSFVVSNLFYTNPDLIFEIAKEEVNGAYTVVYRSDRALNTLEPTWDMLSIDFGALCNTSVDTHLRFALFIAKDKGQRILVGITETTLGHVLRSFEDCPQPESELEDDVDATDFFHTLQLQRHENKMKNVGHLLIQRAFLRRAGEQQNESRTLTSSESDALIPEAVDLTELIPMQPGKTFSEYVQLGLQINLFVAIDFSSSNGDPRLPSSLHFQNGTVLNDYEETIQSIGDVVLQYSTSDECTVWGFGAKYGGELRHIFQCGQSSTVTGTQGILKAYKSAFQSGITMSGPTQYTKILQAVGVHAKKYHDCMDLKRFGYQVLVIISDGNPTQIEEMQRKLSVYSSLPLHVVIVGVGSRADFSIIRSLAANKESVTFVEFRKHQQDPAALSRAALSTLPDRITRYLNSRNFTA